MRARRDRQRRSCSWTSSSASTASRSVAYILTSWFRLPYSLQPVQRFLYDVCEPYLRLWRRLLPFSVGADRPVADRRLLALGIAAQVVIALLDQLH